MTFFAVRSPPHPSRGLCHIAALLYAVASRCLGALVSWCLGVLVSWCLGVEILGRLRGGQSVGVLVSWCLGVLPVVPQAMLRFVL